jgi:putative phage-type endonuclease
VTRTHVTLDRQHYLGGTDIAAILGLSRYKTPLQVWLEKTGREAPQPLTSIAARHGTFCEDFVLELYAEASGNLVDSCEPAVDPEHTFLVGHPDGRVCDELIVEAKTTNDHAFRSMRNTNGTPAWGEPGTDQIPTAYRAQVIHYMGLTGAAACDVAVLVGGRDLLLYRVEHDEALYRAIRGKAIAWWQAHVVADVAPEIVAEEDLAIAFPTDDGDMVDAEPDDLELLEQYRQAKADADAAAERIAAIKLAMQKRLGSHSGLRYDGRPVVTWKEQTRKQIDAAALRKAAPDIAAAVTKETTTRVFRVAKEADQ